MLVAEAPFLAARGGGGRTPCAGAGRLQEFDYFVVVDFEATCEKDVRTYPQEIIEFPSVLVDGATGRLASAFRRYVRPQHHPVLTEFCRDLTGIRQADVDAGVELDEALRLHDAWLEAAAVAGAKKGGLFAVVTWGDWDCRTMLESECRFKGLAMPGYFDRWINLRVPFEAAFGCGGGGRRRAADHPAGGCPGGGARVGGPPALRARRRVQHGAAPRGAHAAGRQAQHHLLAGAAAAAAAAEEASASASGKYVQWRCGGVLVLLRSGEQRRRGGGAGADAGEVLLGVWQLDAGHGSHVPFLRVVRQLNEPRHGWRILVGLLALIVPVRCS